MNSSVSLAVVGGLGGGRAGVRVVLGPAVHQQVVGLLDAVPALVAVHREVAADHAADPAGADLLHPALDVGQVLGAARGRGVAAVGEGVHDEVVDPPLRGQLDQRLQVAVARVHATVGDEPDVVHARRVAQRRLQHLVLGQRAVLHRGVDAGQVLGDDRAGPQVEVTDLGVAHLPLGEPDARAHRGQRGVRVLGPQAVEHRRVGQRDRVPRAVGREPPAVEDHQRDRGHAHAGRAASTIAANDSASSEAPPIRPPSMSGCASSSAALSAFIDPP